MKSKWFVILALIPTIPIYGQTYPRVEVFGGYSHTSSTILDKSFDGNGANMSLAVNSKPWLGVVGDFGVYRTGLGVLGASSSDETFLFGPKVSARNLRFTRFGQALFGGMHLGSTPFGAEGVSSTAFAMAFGGGLDLNMNKTMALRLFQADWLRTHFHGNSTLANWQNTPRVSVGVVFRLSSE